MNITDFSTTSRLFVLDLATAALTPVVEGLAASLESLAIEPGTAPTGPAELELTVSTASMIPRPDTGWYDSNPIRVDTKLTCPAGGPACLHRFDLSTASPDRARFFFLESTGGDNPQVDVLCLRGGPVGSRYSHGFCSASCVRAGDPANLSLLPGETTTLSWYFWIQPSGAATLEFNASWGIQRSQTLVIEPAAVNPVVFLHGILGAMPPGNSVVEDWPQQEGDAIDWSLGPHLDPFTGSYTPLIDTLLKMGLEMNRSLFVITYDWRRPNVRSAAGLRDVLAERVGAEGASMNCAADPDVPAVPYLNCAAKADFVVHSMGGLVLRTYIADLANRGEPGVSPSLSYQDNVDKAVFIATPHRGFPFDYATLHGLTWRDYMDGQVPDAVTEGVDVLGPALDGLLWPYLIMCHYDADEGQPCDDPVLDVFSCPEQIRFDYSRANPFDPAHPGIGSLREMIPEAQANNLPARRYLTPSRFGLEPNYLLDTLGLNKPETVETLRRIGDDPATFDGIYTFYNNDQSTVQRFRVAEPPPLPGSIPGFPGYVPQHRQWHPGGKFIDSQGLLRGKLPPGARLRNHEIQITGKDHVLIVTDPKLQVTVGAILTGLFEPRHIRYDGTQTPKLHTEYDPPTVVLNNADVFTSFLIECPATEPSSSGTLP